MVRRSSSSIWMMDRRFVRSQVDAVDPVIRDVAVEPLNLRAQAAQHVERPNRDIADFRLGHLAGARDLALDDELGHCAVTIARHVCRPEPRQRCAD